VADIVCAVSQPGARAARRRRARGEADPVGPSLAHDLWVSVNAQLNEWLADISLQALVDERLANGALSKPMGIPTGLGNSTTPASRVMDRGVPNSVFALGSAPATRVRSAERLRVVAKAS